MGNKFEGIPAATLVGEYTRFGMMKDDIETASLRDPFANELDRRCEAAGMAIVGTSVAFSHIRKGYPCYENAEEIPADEVYHLLGWLLMKGGAGK